MFTDKKALLLDMNGTFMFGEDRFEENEDFSVYYHNIGGKLPKSEINQIIRAVYDFLAERYPQIQYRHCFPTVECALQEVTGNALSDENINKIVDTFTYHELGYIPDEYAAALHQLHQRFVLAAIIDIWAPKHAWLKEFDRTGISSLFSAISFSSDHGHVKPSPIPMQQVLLQLQINNSEALVIGDSPTRDLGAAKDAGIDCVLVGGASHSTAIHCYANLLAFRDTLTKP